LPIKCKRDLVPLNDRPSIVNAAENKQVISCNVPRWGRPPFLVASLFGTKQTTPRGSCAPP